MQKSKQSIVLIPFFVVLMAISFYLCVWGIDYGLPNKKQTGLIFSSKEEMQALIPAMIKRREKIYKHYQEVSPWHQNANKLPKSENLVINLPDKTVTISELKLDSMRSYLLQSQLPDEPFILKVVSQINWRQLDFNPRFFIYGGMYLYSIGAYIKVGSLFGLVNISDDIQYHLTHPEEMAKLYKIPKIFAALIFILTIPLFFIVGKTFYDFQTGIIGCLFYSFTPITTVYAHFLKPHVSVLPWVLLAMWMASKLLKSNEKKWYILGGLFSGLSAGTFAFSGAIILCPIAGHIIKQLTPDDSSGENVICQVFNQNFFILILATIIGFFIVNPYWFLNFDCVRQEFNFLSSGLKCFSVSAFGFKKYLLMTIPTGVSWPVGILFYGGLFYALVRRSKADLILVSLIIPFVFYVSISTSGWWHENLHMSMVIVPAIILLATRFLVRLFLSGRFRVLGFILTISIVFFTFCNSLYYDLIFLAGDNKLKAGEYINNNVKPNQAIGLEQSPFSIYKGGPPFRQLLYNTIVKDYRKKSDYYIAVAPEIKKDAEFNDNYEICKKISRSRNVLDRIFKNYLIPFVDADVVIYKRK